MKAIKAILWYLAGFIIVPVLCLVTPKGTSKWRYLDAVYGNRYDSIDGDTAYRAKVSMFRRFRWSQLRNPINNLLRAYGPCGLVTKVRHKGYKDYAVIGGEQYYFTQRPLLFGLYWWSGYKLLDDYRQRERPHGAFISVLEVGRMFDNQMILWPIKNKKISIHPRG